MKNILLFALLAAVQAVSAHTPIDDINVDAISQAIAKGDANALSAYFAEEIEVVFNGDGTMLSKAEATTKVKAFFAQHKPSAFSIAHKGTAKGNSSHYCIGDMATASGNYRVYIYLKQAGSDQRIVELRFDK